MGIPALHGNFPSLVDIGVVPEQAGALGRDRPRDMGIRVVVAQLPRQDRGVNAVAVCGELAEQDALHAGTLLAAIISPTIRPMSFSGFRPMACSSRSSDTRNSGPGSLGGSVSTR